MVAESVQRLGYGLDDWDSIPRTGNGIFFFSTTSRLALGPTHHPIQWVPGAITLGTKQLGHAVDCSPHLVPRLRMHGAIPPLPQLFMAWYLVKHKDNFTFTLPTERHPVLQVVKGLNST
jgi:hypothetical protein